MTLSKRAANGHVVEAWRTCSRALTSLASAASFSRRCTASARAQQSKSQASETNASSPAVPQTWQGPQPWPWVWPWHRCRKPQQPPSQWKKQQERRHASQERQRRRLQSWEPQTWEPQRQRSETAPAIVQRPAWPRRQRQQTWEQQQKTSQAALCLRPLPAKQQQPRPSQAPRQTRRHRCRQYQSQRQRDHQQRRHQARPLQWRTLRTAAGRTRAARAKAARHRSGPESLRTQTERQNRQLVESREKGGLLSAASNSPNEDMETEAPALLGANCRGESSRVSRSTMLSSALQRNNQRKGFVSKGTAEQSRGIAEQQAGGSQR